MVQLSEVPPFNWAAVLKRLRPFFKDYDAISERWDKRKIALVLFTERCYSILY
jgi:hypothetical protein